MRGKKQTIEYIREQFRQENYKLLTTEYKNCKQKLEYICPKGHRHSISWAHWQQGERCPYCAGRPPRDIEFVRSEFEKECWILKSTEYVNNKQKLDCICHNGHKHNISWSKWISGRRCPYCSGKAKPTIDFIRQDFEKRGCIFLSSEYKNCDGLLSFICPNGHRHKVSWSNWRRNHKCGICSGNVLPKNYVETSIENAGYTLVGNVVKTHENMHLICPNGHHYFVSWANWNSKEYRCPQCNDKHTSKWEIEIKSFLDDSNIDYIPNDRLQLINPNTKRPLELDVWMPELNKAIECNGIYWHRCSNRERKNCDNIKQQLCKDKNIDLLVITDKEWSENIEKCKSKIVSFVENQKEIND